MITLDGKHGWVVSYLNKHNLTNNAVSEIHNNSWTMCTTIKPNWKFDELPKNIAGKGYQGAAMALSGKHSGIFSLIWPAQHEGREVLHYMIKGELWYTNRETGKEEIIQVDFVMHDENMGKSQHRFLEEWLDICLSYDNDNETLTMSVRAESQDEWNTKEEKLGGKIIDYTGGHVWIGCANAFDTQSNEQFWKGYCKSAGLFAKKLDDSERDRFFKEYPKFKGIAKYFRGYAHRRQVYNFEQMKPIVFTNFLTTTHYKAYDFSGNGNHPMIYKEEWGLY